MNYFEKKVKKTINLFNLINKKDKIAVAVSGGKDSLSTLFVLNKLGYNIQALFIDLGIKGNSDENLKRIKIFCKEKNIKLNVFDLKKETGLSLPTICKKISSKNNYTNCAICGIIKRYYLNKAAKELKVDKIATGHNLDDEFENIMLNIFSNNFEISLNLGPKSKEGLKKDFVQRIKPLYLCENYESEKYAKKNNLNIYPEICPLRVNAFRKQIRDFAKKIISIKKDAKLNLVINFNKKIIKFKKNHNDFKIKKCIKCNEPSRHELCKKCELFNLL